MLLLAHITVGAAIGSALGNPILAVAASFLSFFIVDCIPHWEFNYLKKDLKTKTIIISDIVISIISSFVLSVAVADFINSSHASNSDVFTFNLSTVHIPGLTQRLSPVLLLCCLFAALPGFLKYFEVLMNKNFEWLKWNNKLQKFFHNADNGFLGKLVQPATVIVFILYSFRLLPNSDTSSFVQILTIMVIIVAFLAILETFTAEEKK